MRFQVVYVDNMLYVNIMEGNLSSSSLITQPYAIHIFEDPQNNLTMIARQPNGNGIGVNLKENKFLEAGVSGNECGMPGVYVHATVKYEMTEVFHNALKQYLTRSLDAGVLVPIILDTGMSQEQLETAIADAYDEASELAAVPNSFENANQNALLSEQPVESSGGAGAGVGGRRRKTHRRRNNRHRRTYRKY